MRAGEFVTELFSPGKQNWKWRVRTDINAIADFTVGDRIYHWQAFSHQGNPTKWEVQFSVGRKETDPWTMDIWGKTGTGNSTEVLSTAVDIIRSFLRTYGLDKVEEINFNAKEDSRIELYAKMIKRLLPDWDLYSKKDPENGMQFTLTDRRAYDKPENKIVEAFRVSLDKLVPTRDSYDWNQMDPDVVDIFAKRAGTPEWDDKQGTLYVRPRPDGKYDIINGHHRYAGLKKAGVKHALVTLKNNDEDN
jgi:hypothetical protein